MSERLVGSQIVDSYTQRKNEWVLEMRGKGSSKQSLLLGCDGQYPYILLSDNNKRGKNSTEIMPFLISREIAEIDILPGERIIEIRFKELDESLMLRFFTHRSNFFWVDGSGVIQDSFKQSRQLIGEKYSLPQGQRQAILGLTLEVFQLSCQSEPQLQLTECLKRFDLLSKPLIREILWRSELKGDMLVRELSDEHFLVLYAQTQDLLLEMQTENAVVYLEDELPFRLTLSPFFHLAKYQKREFQDINAALRWFNFRTIYSRALIQKKKQFTTILSRKRKAVDYALKQISETPQGENKSEMYQKIGQLITSQPHLLAGKSETVELIDYYDEKMSSIEIKIDPEKNAKENADLYFQKAALSRMDMNARQGRFEQLQEQLTILEQLEKELADSNDLKKIERIEKELKSRHMLQFSGAREAQIYHLPYKQYVHKGYAIWVGRNARDNDELTFRHASKDDVWMHVQGYSGSHVVIRKSKKLQEIPEVVLNYAARLAVTFSAAKHASYVPVIYTLVKYVRKPRKAPPGTVMPERGKSIFADPLKKI